MAFAVDGKLMTECCFCSHVLEEPPTETWDHTYTLPTYNKQTMKFFAIYAKTSVQFDEGTPRLPNLGSNTWKGVHNDP
jgi:hypothetical protein